MNASPSGSRRPRRRLAWALAGGLVTLLLADSYLPRRPYVAYCPGQELWIEGPYRERFVWVLSEELWLNGIPHLTYRDNIYRFGWGGNELYNLFADSFDFQLNTDWKLAAKISWGVKIDDVWFPPPERLLNALRANEAKHGTFAERDKKNRYSHSRYFVFSEDCEVFKAAILPEMAFKSEGGSN